MSKPNQLKIENKLVEKCPDGLCPVGIDNLKEIKLTPKEKRLIYFQLKDQIFKQKKLLRELPLF